MTCWGLLAFVAGFRLLGRRGRARGLAVLSSAGFVALLGYAGYLQREGHALGRVWPDFRHQPLAWILAAGVLLPSLFTMATLLIGRGGRAFRPTPPTETFLPGRGGRAPETAPPTTPLATFAAASQDCRSARVLAARVMIAMAWLGVIGVLLILPAHLSR